MNQEKISIFIKEIRKKNNLTQQAFAKQFNVTYQAVSKWENGKNIPDIETLKLICEKYHQDINELLTDTKKKKKKKYLIYILIIILVIVFISIIIINKKNNDFKFKTLSTTCNSFEVTGSIAYNKDKSSIYISNIDYCGEDQDIKYNNIECTLYEHNGKKETKISSYKYNKKDNITLKDFFKEITFNIDSYSNTCKEYKNNSLYLLITANNNRDDKITTYKIYLNLEDNCNVNK